MINSQKEFSSVISSMFHDVANPITSITSASQITNLSEEDMNELFNIRNSAIKGLTSILRTYYSGYSGSSPGFSLRVCIEDYMNYHGLKIDKIIYNNLDIKDIQCLMKAIMTICARIRNNYIISIIQIEGKKEFDIKIEAYLDQYKSQVPLQKFICDINCKDYESGSIHLYNWIKSCKSVNAKYDNNIGYINFQY